MTFIKHDKSKPDLTQVPYEAMCAIARPLQWAYESGRYPKNNWRLADEEAVPRIAAAAMRHLAKWVDPEESDTDEDSGLSHLDHAICDLAMLIMAVRRTFRSTRNHAG